MGWLGFVPYLVADQQDMGQTHCKTKPDPYFPVLSDAMRIDRLETMKEIVPIFREYLGWMRQFYTIYDFDSWCERGVKNLQEHPGPEGLLVYTLKASETIIGFALVNKHLRFNRDGLSMAEFYIQKKYGRSGWGKRLAEHIFYQYPGPWEVAVALKNKDARMFWKQVISSYTSGEFMEKTKASFTGSCFLFNSES